MPLPPPEAHQYRALQYADWALRNSQPFVLEAVQQRDGIRRVRARNLGSQRDERQDPEGCLRDFYNDKNNNLF